jgi:pantothenate kinase
VKSPINDLAEALILIRNLLEASNTRVIIGITGQPGAGKSTFAKMILNELDDGLATIVPMDGFHYSNSALNRLGRLERKGAPDTFDAHGFKELLKRIRVETVSDIYFPIFHREVEESYSAEGFVTSETKLVITEGNYLLMETEGWTGISELLDECWYLVVEDDVRRNRLISRHQLYGKDAEAAKTWTDGSDEKNAESISSTKHRADRLVRL